MFSNKTDLFPSKVSGVYIRLSPPEKYNTGKFLGYQKEWQRRYYGEVTKVETLNYRTYKPEMEGLFCEKIFGPIKDWECNCGKYKGIKYSGNVCDKCGVLVTEKRVRQERMGYINLVIPIVHTWYFRAMSNKIGILLSINAKNLEKIIYYERYIVINQGIVEGVSKFDLLGEEEYCDIKNSLPEDNHLLDNNDPNKFIALMGGEAIELLLQQIDLDKLYYELISKLNNEKSHIKRIELSKRIAVVSSFRESNTEDKENKPEWMVMRILPVLPADLRPLVQLSGGKFATADINDLYRRVIIRKNRLSRLLEVKAPDIILRNEKRMLQEAVDAVIERPQSRERENKVEVKKSLSDALKGKTGLFRQNLLGKRVDYSARSVIVVGPHLKLYECGLPKAMALELYKPFVIRRLIERKIVETVKFAKNLIAKCDPVVWPIVESVIKGHPVLLNRAPTLHRLSIQAFQPILVQGKAIQLHPLLCTAFNADFDGDQMAVHVPLSTEAIVESSLLLLSSQNIFNPANGKAITLPSKDIVLGCYYITKIRPSLTAGKAVKIFSSFDEVLLALNLDKLTLHELIRVRVKRSVNGGSEIIETSAGRVKFNLCLPKEMGFVNEEITGRRLQLLVSEIQRKTNTVATVEFLDRVKIFGFEAAYKGGISISLKDIIVPTIKSALIDSAQYEVDDAYNHYASGLITENERYNRSIDVWTATSAQITHHLMNELKNDNEGFNPIYMMVESGARGSREQIRQLGGIRGLMAKPNNNNTLSNSYAIIEHPILSNFKEGLNSIEYHISAHGGRKGLADSALKTADAGYLTRKVVEVCQDVVVTEDDCGAVIGVVESALEENDEVIETLADRVLGRIVVKDVFDPIRNELFVKAGEMIDADCAERIENSTIKSIEIRSIFKCRLKRGVCVKCYGINFGSGRLAQIGDAVGVIAAHSIGEPGTQLTLKTFQVGGAAAKIVSDSNLEAKFDGIIFFKDLLCVAVENSNNTTVNVVLSRSCEVSILDEVTKGVLFSHHIAYGSYLRYKQGDKIKKGEEICYWDPYNGVMLADYDGTIDFDSIEIGTNCIREFDEQTGKKDLIIIESKNKDKYANLLLKVEGKSDVVSYSLPVKAHVNVEDGQKIKAGHVLYKLPRDIGKSRDITGGLPRVTELLEVRNISNAAVLSEINGVVSYGSTKSNVLDVFVESKSGVKKKYSLNLFKRVFVQPNDFVEAGEMFSEGVIAPLDLLNVKGLCYIQKYLVNELQEVYRLQGVKINDKHMEVIINQMIKKVEVVYSGDTSLVQSQIIDKSDFFEINNKIIDKKVITNSGDSEKYNLDQIISIRDFECENKLLAQTKRKIMFARNAECATAKIKLQGITRTSLGSDSFLSAASFQEVTKVLSDAALRGDVDNLKGLKESVIVGKLIPAGSGLRSLKGYTVKSKREVL